MEFEIRKSWIDADPKQAEAWEAFQKFKKEWYVPAQPNPLDTRFMKKQAVFLACLILASCSSLESPPSSQHPTDVIGVLQSSEQPNEVMSAASRAKKTSPSTVKEGRTILLTRAANTPDPGLAHLFQIAYLRTFDIAPQPDWSVYESLNAIAVAVNFELVCEETLAVELRNHKGPKLSGAVSTDQLLKFLSDLSMDQPWAFVFWLEKNQLGINLRPVGRPR
jgi:hypothetical protein